MTTKSTPAVATPAADPIPEAEFERHESGVLVPKGSSALPPNAPRVVDAGTKLDGDTTPEPEEEVGSAEAQPSSAPPAAPVAPETLPPAAAE